MGINKKNNLTKYTPRPYQEEAIQTATDFTKNHITKALEKIKQVAFEDISVLLEMATGSGKTFTVGTYLDDMIRFRNRYNSRYNTKEFQGMNVLFLTNRIDGLDQFRDDVVYGRDGENPKPAFLSDEVKENLRVKTFHSKADNLDDIDKKYWTTDELDEDSMQNEKINGEDTFFFSTFQTAILKEIEDKIPYLDMIVIDEAHNVRGNSDYQQLLENLIRLTRNDRTPMILPVTATPTTVTKELFGDPKFIFGLAEYLASKYSPSVDYRLITSSNATPDQIQEIGRLVEEAKNIDDLKDKKTHVNLIQEKFHEIMSHYASVTELVNDLLDKRITRDPKETIIYANSIQEANQIRNEINKQLGEEIAVSYHSANDSKQSVDWSNDKKTSLERFSSPLDQAKIIIAIGKLNESVDIPTVENVVFWRDTDIEKVFLQQFGRGLRGDGTVKYFDYVGGIKNFSWIGNIYEEYMNYSSSNQGKSEEASDGGGTSDKFSISSGNVFPEEHGIDLHDILFDFSNIQQEVARQQITKEDIEDYFFNYEGRGKEESFGYWMNITSKDTLDINFEGYKITQLARICGFDTIKYPPQHIRFFRDFISFIFGRESYNEFIILEFKNFFFNYEGRTKKESFSYWMKVGGQEIKSISLFGKKIKSIASTLGWKNNNGDYIESPKGFKAFISYLFDMEDDNKLTREKVEDYFFNYEGRNKDENFEYWMKVPQKEFIAINLYGNKIHKISIISGWKNEELYNINTLRGFQSFISYLFNKELLTSQKELTRSEIEDYFFNYEGRNKDEGFKYWMHVKHENILNIEILGRKITQISSASGWKNENGYRVQSPKGFKAFISYLFDMEDDNKLTREKVEDYFFNYEGRNKDENFEYWMGINQIKIRKISILENSILRISSLFGWNNKDSKTTSSKGFKLFIKYLFGREDK